MTVIPNRGKSIGGYTLIEAVISLSLFMTVTVFSVNLLNIASKVSTKLIVEAELLENARIAIDVITAHVREAEKIKLTVDSETGTLKELIVSVRKSAGLHEYKFAYNSGLSYGHARYHRIDFGGNELASYISNVVMTIDNETLHVKITTDRMIDPGFYEHAQQLVLRSSISLKYKEYKTYN